MVKLSVLAAITLLLACAEPAAPPAAGKAPVELTLAEWRKTEGLANPESLLAGADGQFYVSNVNGEGEAKDGNGFIATMTPGGPVAILDWVTGLDAPKGMALKDGRLFVSDIDRIVEISTSERKVVARHAARGAKFLNDVALAPDGSVLASDSGGARIYALKEGAVSVWLADAALSSINGLLPEASRLIVTTMDGKLLAIDWTTKAITTLASDLGQADGVAALGDGAYIVGEWPGRLFEVKADGTSRVVLDMREAKVLLNDFLLIGDTLHVPNWEPGTVTAYRVSR
jgi:hypothetical protein